MAKTTIYSTENLKAIVDKYAAQHLSEKINIKNLVSFSGISKTTWYKNEEIKNYISKLNTGSISSDDKDFTEEMTPAELYLSTKGNPEKIISILAKLQASIGVLTEQVKSTKKPLNNIDTAELTNKLVEKDKIIANLNKKINEITYRNPKLMTMNDDTMDSLDSRTFSQQFGDLFED